MSSDFYTLKELYWDLIKDYSRIGFRDMGFEFSYLPSESSIYRFLVNFECRILSKKIVDIDESTTNTSLDELVNMERDLINLKEEKISKMNSPTPLDRLVSGRHLVEEAVQQVIAKRKSQHFSHRSLARQLCPDWHINEQAAATEIDIHLENPVYWFATVPRHGNSMYLRGGVNYAVRCNGHLTTAQVASIRMSDYLHALNFSEQEARDIFEKLKRLSPNLEYKQSPSQPVNGGVREDGT